MIGRDKGREQQQMNQTAMKQVHWIKGKKFEWDIVKSILAGVSVVDLQKLGIQNRDQGMAYAMNYGLDLNRPSELQLVQNIHIESIDFIENRLLHDGSETENIEVPSTVSAPANPLDLLTYASGHDKGTDPSIQAWSCSVLKVMHCFFQLEYDLKLKNINTIRKQIFSDYESLLNIQNENISLEDESESLPLFFFKFKRNKNRGSIILKLLHKRSHVPSDIYDHLGIRFVLNTKVECLLALDFLWRHNLINEANIKPSRSKNTLIDVPQARALFKKYRKQLDSYQGYPLDIYKKMDKELKNVKPKESDISNPFSSKEYRSIQFTVRKMISLKEVSPFEHWPMLQNPKITQFYFDYEIQLIDKSCWLKTRRGPTSHAAYKKRQIQRAKVRVLGPWLNKHLMAGAEQKMCSHE